MHSLYGPAFLAILIIFTNLLLICIDTSVTLDAK